MPTADPARRLPGIDIEYGNSPPAFAVGYGGRTRNPDRPSVPSATERVRIVTDATPTNYDVMALPGFAKEDVYYAFRIHAEWRASQDATWSACEEKDPFIANN